MPRKLWVVNGDTIWEVNEEAPVLLSGTTGFPDNHMPFDFGNVWLKSDKYLPGTVL